MSIVVESQASKTEKKRQMQALAKLVNVILTLPTRKFSELPLSEQIINEFKLAKSLNSNNALRRQKRFLTRLLSDTSLTQLHILLDGWEKSQIKEVKRFHLVEQWRYRLLHEENALELLCGQYSKTTKPKLQNIISDIKRVGDSDKRPARELFRILQTILKD